MEPPSRSCPKRSGQQTLFPSSSRSATRYLSAAQPNTAQPNTGVQNFDCLKSAVACLHPHPTYAELSTLLLPVQDTTRPIVKNHHSVVLRAETAAEKFSWLNRLLAASGNPQAARAASSKAPPGKPTSPEQPKVPTTSIVLLQT